ncbi:hypothetical protein RFI_06434, partial [Reticulomyxa filosa]
SDPIIDLVIVNQVCLFFFFFFFGPPFFFSFFFFFFFFSEQSKDMFPDLEERLKGKKWFTGKVRANTQEDEEDWGDDSDSDGEKNASSPKDLGHLPSLRTAHPPPFRKDGSANDIAVKPPSSSTSSQPITRSVSEKRHSQLKDLVWKALPVTSKHSSPPPIIGPETDINEFKTNVSLLPSNIDPSIRGVLEEMEQKYQVVMANLQNKYFAEKTKNKEYEKQIQDLKEEVKSLNGKIDSLMPNGEKDREK